MRAVAGKNAREGRGSGREHRTTRRAVMGAAAAGAIALALPRLSAAQQPTVAIYPAAGTWTASPGTEISFRGISAEELGPVYVTGSVRGGLSGVMAPHGDGNGVSYLPDAPFVPGEMVRVEASGLPEAHEFGVARPVPWWEAMEARETAAPEDEPRVFRSRPDLLPPAINVTTPPAETAPGYIFVGAKVTDGQNGALMLDNTGDVVWFGLPKVTTSMIYDFKVQHYRGEPVLTWMEGTTPSGFGAGHFVIANSAYERIAEFQVGNGFDGGDLHELMITSRDTALVIVYSAIEWDLSPVGGPKHGTVTDAVIQEIEIDTGRVLFEWHSLDHIPVEESRIGFGGLDNGDRPFDYVHLNSIDEDSDGNLLISGRHIFAVHKIDRATGEIIWRLNGSRSDFEMGEGTQFAWQHDARMQEDGTLTLFDNAESNQDLDGTVASRGMVLDLDEEAMTATLVREYIHPTEILSTSQANMQVLPNGNVFIGWGSAPVFSEFTEDGELIFNGRFPAAGTSYRAYRHEWIGQPAEPPAIALERGEDDAVTVFASWNGATEVASWRVLSGPSADDLSEIGSAARAGFETAIGGLVADSYIVVEALDAGGAVLGASDPVED